MNKPLKQHLIDPEICIRCYTCEMTCPVGAIEHDENNVVVNPDTCNFCMDCIPVCPTGSIDEWRVVDTPYSLEEQYEWMELPEQGEVSVAESAEEGTESGEDPVAALLAEAHKGAGGKAKAPASAAKPTVNLYNLANPVEAVARTRTSATSSSIFRASPFQPSKASRWASSRRASTTRARRICHGSTPSLRPATASARAITTSL